MPHFENSFATRGAPILSASVLRDFSARDHLSWEHVARIRRQWPGALVIKGILHPDDAALAREHGVDGIIVSNHGGRQLDGAVPPLALPRVLDAAGDMPVMLDSGVRRGGDVLKALALRAACSWADPSITRPPSAARPAWRTPSACCAPKSTATWPCSASTGSTSCIPACCAATSCQGADSAMAARGRRRRAPAATASASVTAPDISGA